MINVEFKLQSSDLKSVEIVNAEFAEEEIDLLKQFIAYSDRTSESRLLQTGLPAINRMIYSNGDFRMECEDYSNGDLYELLHLLRPLILDDERASFEKVRNLIAKKLSHSLVKSKLKAIKKEYDNGSLAAFMQIKVNDVNLFSDRTFKLWLNGLQYHTDEEKRASWIKISSALTEPNARAYLITQIHSKINAIEKLYFLAKLILAPKDPDNKLSITLP